MVYIFQSLHHSSQFHVNHHKKVLTCHPGRLKMGISSLCLTASIRPALMYSSSYKMMYRCTVRKTGQIPHKDISKYAHAQHVISLAPRLLSPSCSSIGGKSTRRCECSRHMVPPYADNWASNNLFLSWRSLCTCSRTTNSLPGNSYPHLDYSC